MIGSSLYPSNTGPSLQVAADLQGIDSFYMGFNPKIGLLEMKEVATAIYFSGSCSLKGKMPSIYLAYPIQCIIRTT
jgi:hypothetical protein